MGLASIYIAYRAGKKKVQREWEDVAKAERLERKRRAPKCFRCGYSYADHKRDNFYRCP